MGPSAAHRSNEIFHSVFPKPNFTSPTPESTPNIGASSPGVPFGGFVDAPTHGSHGVNNTVKYNRAWSTATRFLSLTTTPDRQLRPISHDVIEAISFLLQVKETEQELIAWYTNDIGTHFRGFVLPEFQVWQGSIPVSKADEAVSLAIRVLQNARKQYFSPLDGLTTSIRRRDLQKRILTFKTKISQAFSALVLHSLPRQRLQKTLSSVVFHHLDTSLRQNSNPERCIKSDACHCTLSLEKLPLAELSEVGLGGLLAERALAHAVHRFLQGSAIQRPCFAVDWAGLDCTGYRSTVPKLRDWVSNQLASAVRQALSVLKQDAQWSSAPADIQQLASIAVNNLGRTRTDALFDYVKAWPASRGAVLDIWEYLNAGGTADKVHVCSTFSAQIQRRLLHAGATTSEILSIYVNMIHTFNALDGRGVLLEKVAVPVRSYLRGRDDTVSIIASSFLADVDKDGVIAAIDADKCCLDITLEVSNTTLAPTSDKQTHNWDDMEWMPDPIDAVPDYRSSRSEDVVAQILGLFEQEEFVKEITTVLAQHLLHSTDSNYAKETRLVELLKSRLDATKLQAAEVMLKDMRDSVALGKRINPSSTYETSSAAPTPREIQLAIPEEGITLTALYSMFDTRIKRAQFLAALRLVANKRNDLFYAKRTRIPSDRAGQSNKQDSTNFEAQILSSFFWPQLRMNEFNMPQAIAPLQNSFEERFNQLGSQRRLQFRPALARMSLKIELEDRVVEELDVPGWRASVIDAFSPGPEPASEDGLSLMELMERLQMEEELVLDALNFWSNKHVLFQPSPDRYAVLERLDMDVGSFQQQGPQDDDMVSAVKSQDTMLRESAPMFETFIANMLRNQGGKEVGGMMGITNLLKMVLPTFTYGDDEVRWLLSEMERKKVVQKNGDMWSIV
jgi:anaphase-promoting complex subunit 2